MMTTVPDHRIRAGNRESLNRQGRYVLYWMTAFRRLGWNYSLQHAADLSRRLEKPLVILEALLVDYPFASFRFHHFLLQGMAERKAALRAKEPVHYPFVERRKGDGDGLLEALAGEACCVVADDFPSFFIPRMLAAAGRGVRVRMELVDSNGLLPLQLPEREFSSAYHFRRYLQKVLPDHLPEYPDPSPLSESLPAGDALIPEGIRTRWPQVPADLLAGSPEALSRLPLDRSPTAVALPGTSHGARNALERFLGEGLPRYHQDRNHPDHSATSGLSPYLHFGLISSHEVFSAVSEAEGWTPLRLSSRTDGKREGWWGMGPGAEAFLDQIITWRELGFNMTSRREDYADYTSLPEWARKTLAHHQGDPRPHLYTLEEFRDAETHDRLWNAAQRQLLEEGVIHNYLRMLWGKKILEWSPSARDALEVMLELNDSLALDGRDPNSYSGIFWCLGRYDRGWPERPIYGKVRSMSSDATTRKVKLDKYMERFSS
ncbi:MAG: hypothetical protein R6T96_15140 [Longimicrobiales bacterium]